MSRIVRTFPPLDVEPVRVMTCDDTPELRELLHYFLDREEGTVLVAEAEDGRQALRLAPTVLPELIVLDLGMPGPGPAELVERLHGAVPGAAIVLYSGTAASVLGSSRLLLAMEIAKGTPPSRVVERIRDLGRARRNTSPTGRRP